MSAGRTVISLSQEWGTPHKYVEAIKELKADFEAYKKTHP